MKPDLRLERILDNINCGKTLQQSECRWLLSLHETSFDASLLRAAADAVSRKRFNNSSILLGQVGIEIDNCPGKCKFCSFGDGHSTFVPGVLTTDELKEVSQNFTSNGNLFALFLMTMHTFDFESLLDKISLVKSYIPKKTQLVVNIGDFDSVQAAELRAAGVDGSYHVLRLREGIDTDLDPEQRKSTIQTIRESELDWYYCCEPVGPEHTVEELTEQIYLGLEYGCFQHAAMRRVYLPSAPLAKYGEISELRLAQIVAVITLATLSCPETRSIAVHEPNLIGLTSGANTIYAEAGANPRDSERDTSKHRGRDIEACKRMLFESGFSTTTLYDHTTQSLKQCIN